MKKILKPLLLTVFPLIFIMTYVVVFKYMSATEEKIMDNYIDKLRYEYDIIVSEYTNMANFINLNQIQKESVLEVLYDASLTEDELVKNELRATLLRQLSPLYNNLKTFNFRQLHFHTADNLSFLRFHKPETYGDDLMGIRLSVEYVNREKKSISGFEEGRIFNGYRNLYPLMYNEKHIGSVEISISIAAIIDQIANLYHQESQFILLKSVVLEKVFSSEQSNYSEWTIDPRFVLDKGLVENYSLADHILKKDSDRIAKSLSSSLLDGEPFSIEVNYDQEKRVLSFLPIRNFTGNTVAYLFLNSDNERLVELRRSFWLITSSFLCLIVLLAFIVVYSTYTGRRIKYMAFNDQLTGISSRRMILTKLKEEYLRSKRYGTVFSICMIDIDHFKNVNDTYGHMIGDHVLKELATVVIKNIRSTDHFGRYGGEEFILILLETEGDAALHFLDDLRLKIAQHQFATIGNLTISGGIATYTHKYECSEDLIDDADKNLYLAKKNGRNQVVFEV
ncbi:sensor domain-containing diguanylate cyclase [Oceanispirochaeta crateris]|nr:diguanylate cyclase [Oceanispirochaeta crateris]